jgi:hypothetical protein
MASRAEKPRRAHVLSLYLGANSAEDLIDALNSIAMDIRLGRMASAGCSGSPSAGRNWNYDIDESWTKERYFTALDEHLGLASHG